jgi:hypothetical protein
MASTISAGTSAGTAIAIAGDTSGNLAFTTQAGTYTQTLPNATGTVMVSGNMPAFSVFHQGGNQSVSNATYTKIAFNSESFDTNNNFDSTTNYRFTPQVAGYYLISLTTEDASGTALSYQYTVIYKNGSAFCKTLAVSSTSGTSGITTAVVYLNGSTDYIEGYYYFSGSGTVSLDGGTGVGYNTFMSGSLVRSA